MSDHIFFRPSVMMLAWSWATMLLWHLELYSALVGATVGVYIVVGVVVRPLVLMLG